MKVHSVLRKQQRSAQGIRNVSFVIFILVVAIMLFSFFVQNLFTQERNAGRDIRTEADYFLIEIFKVRTHTTLFYLDTVKTQKEIEIYTLQENLLQKYHTYLQKNSIIKQAYQMFDDQEETYTIILNYIALFQHKIISESLALLFISYTTTYARMLQAFELEYTNLFVLNNNSTFIYNIASTLVELAIISFFFFRILFPEIKRFIVITKESDRIQNELIQTKSQINSVVREKGQEAYKLYQDVACVKRDMYIVGYLGETYTVFYHEKDDVFICECNTFLLRRSCWHTNRATWLHKEIYK